MAAHFQSDLVLTMKAATDSTPSSNQLWLHSKSFDLALFHLSALFCLLFMIPYALYQERATVPIYNIYLLFFGIPHNFLTWTTFLSKEVKGEYEFGSIRPALITCFILCLVMYLVPDTDLEGWILSIITYASLWHAYRQHHGICKVYDAVQARRNGAPTIFADRKVINLGFGLCLFSILVWIFTYPRVEFLLSADAMYDLVYPQIPYHLFQGYVAISAAILLYGVKQLTWDRYRRGEFIPWPQLLLMAMALATYIIPFSLLPLEALPVGVAIATMFHNIQYFGFVWLFERTRGDLREEKNLPVSKMGSWATGHNWLAFFGVALAYSFLLVGLYGIWPTRLLLTTIYFLAFAHYIIDGYIWNSQHNHGMEIGRAHV